MQVLPISHVPSLSWQRERREWMPGVKIKGKHQIVGRILGQNREVYLGTWLVHFKSVSHIFKGMNAWGENQGQTSNCG